jgi:SAM-dependent methyltransferase
VPVADYTLAVSDAEIGRYRMMAQQALVQEAAQLAVAGVTEGAVVADVGSGPAAMSVELGRLVGPSGLVVAVEREEQALAAAGQLVEQSGLTNVEVRQGTATDTGLPERAFDIAMMRHVLAHNGGDEQRIVDHVASLVHEGGAVYLVDVDLTAFRMLDGDPDLDDMAERYTQVHRSLGNDPSVGLRLGKMLEAAHLDVVHFSGTYTIITAPPGLRPPAWAARDAMVAQGTVKPEDIARWGAALDRTDAAPVRPTLFAPSFVAVGRRV